jgi:hypothetical protein
MLLREMVLTRNALFGGMESFLILQKVVHEAHSMTEVVVPTGRPEV